MERQFATVNTKLGEVRVKIASIGDFKKFAPEYEYCHSIAKKTGIPLEKIYNMVTEEYGKTHF